MQRTLWLAGIAGGKNSTTNECQTNIQHDDDVMNSSDAEQHDTAIDLVSINDEQQEAEVSEVNVSAGNLRLLNDTTGVQQWREMFATIENLEIPSEILAIEQNNKKDLIEVIDGKQPSLHMVVGGESRTLVTFYYDPSNSVQPHKKKDRCLLMEPKYFGNPQYFLYRWECISCCAFNLLQKSIK